MTPLRRHGLRGGRRGGRFRADRADVLRWSARASARRPSAAIIPLLRKDFIVDEYQLVEAVADGADAVLLIVSALPDEGLKSLKRQARGMGLATLVEVHDDGELQSRTDAGADIVGVNNRTFERWMSICASPTRLHAPAGQRHRGQREWPPRLDDLHRLQSIGYRAFLIGERFMTAEDPGKALSALLSAARGPRMTFIKFCGMTRAEDIA